ncbi:MAG: zf-HC2 domain-containing protein [Dehalobacterium sp.]
MNCKQAQEYLSPYLDQILSQEEKDSLEKHLEKCSVCRQELEDLQETLNMIQTLPELPLPTGFHQELHNKLVAVKAEEEGKKGSILLSIFRSIYSIRNQWASLGMAAVLLLFFYVFLSPAMPKSMEQSDMSYTGTAQNEKKADLADQGNLETAESQVPEAAIDTKEKVLEDREEKSVKNEQNSKDNDTGNNTEKSAQDNEIVTMTSEEENQEAGSKEQIRQNAVEAARGKTNGGEAKTQNYSMAAIAPDENLDTAKEKSILKYTDFQLMVKDDDYKKVFERINSLSEELSDVLAVVYEKIDEEGEGFIISVAKDAVPNVLAEINTIENSVHQDVYGADALSEHEYTSIRIIIKEN